MVRLVDSAAGYTAGALDVLVAVAGNETQPASARVAPAKVLLEHALQLHDLVGIETRLSELEARGEAISGR